MKASASTSPWNNLAYLWQKKYIIPDLTSRRSSPGNSPPRNWPFGWTKGNVAPLLHPSSLSSLELIYRCAGWCSVVPNLHSGGCHCEGDEGETAIWFSVYGCDFPWDRSEVVCAGKTVTTVQQAWQLTDGHGPLCDNLILYVISLAHPLVSVSVLVLGNDTVSQV